MKERKGLTALKAACPEVALIAAYLWTGAVVVVDGQSLI